MLDVVLQQSFLEALIVVGVAIAVIGVFWKVILIGGSFLLFAMVVMNHTQSFEVKSYSQPRVEMAKTVQPKIDPRRAEYVRDCVGHGFTKQWCEDNWDDKLKGE